MISVPLILASGRRCGALGAGPHVRAGMAGRGPMLVPLNCATGGRCGALGAGPHMRAGMAGRGAAMGAWVCGGRIPIMAIDALEMAIASSNVTGIAFSSFFFVGVPRHNSQGCAGVQKHDCPLCTVNDRRSRHTVHVLFKRFSFLLIEIVT